MKKALLAIFAFLYLSVSTGMALNVHYCMGEIAGVDMGIFSHKSCACKPTTQGKKNKCCEDTVQLVKLETDQKTHIQTAHDFSYFDALVISIFPIDFKKVPVSIDPQVDSRENPPPNLDKPIYLRNNVFRI